MMRDILLQNDVIKLRKISENQRVKEESGTYNKQNRPRLGGSSPGNMQSLTPDSWSQRLLKFIPSEAMGFYLAVDRAIYTSSSLQNDNKKHILIILLISALIISIVFNIMYLKYIWLVSRKSQIFVSTISLIAYVYSVGGCFAPVGWTDPTAQMIVVILVASFLAFFKPPEPLNIGPASTSSALPPTDSAV